MMDDDSDCRGCTGVGGKKQYTITANSSGEAIFIIKHKRSWEQESIDLIEIDVKVEAKPE